MIERPWDLVRRLRAQGWRFELTADRAAFHVRPRETLSAEDEAAIRADRSNILLHLQHLDPPETLKQQAARGWPGFEGRPQWRNRFNRPQCEKAESSSSEDLAAARRRLLDCLRQHGE